MLKHEEKREVYKIPITDKLTNEKSSYIGVTKRTIATCIEEHKRDIKHANLTTTLAMETYNRDIKVDWKEVKQIKSIKEVLQQVIVESVEIMKRMNNEKLINDRLNWEPPPTWRYIIEKEKRPAI